MSYRGHVKDGVVVLDGNQRLEEGSLVEVTPLAPKTLADRLPRSHRRGEGFAGQFGREP